MKMSIKRKFIIGFLVIFYIGYNTMSFFMNKLIVENNKEIISKELVTFEKDLNTYLRQYFELKNKDMYSNNFNNSSNGIASDLSIKVGNRIMIYSYEGKFLVDSANANGKVLNYEDSDNKNNYSDEDLKISINNKSAFTIVPVKDKYLVVFSCPIINNKKSIGIVRSVMDYSEIFSSSKNLLKLTNTFVLLVFGVIFLFVVLVATKITIPILKLSKVIKEVAKGNFEEDINITSKDEIEELSLNFNKMKNRIKNQIETIENDRDDLRKIAGHRKVFFDNITHEMKTPLTIISGYCQILVKQDFKDKEFARKSMKKINDESERMHNMVIELLEISKVESNLISYIEEEVNVSQILGVACNDMKIRANKYEIHIEKVIDKEVIVLGNPNEIRRVIINIIDNSIKYGNVNSTINVKLSKENGNCNIIIKDKGQGIPSNKLEMIFEPFYRVDKQISREAGSSGLGLSIVKKIIDKHNGSIKIISEKGKGTEVHIVIPLKVYNIVTSC
ncbi:HAMP domain-containing sensor histidine kinase [Clostridium tagluense]|uniref:HAMP domain-containing sensor histidine kinase n=1 Tax=Clostridium tagluense TaxID=360422 RepID=UPI001C0C63D4|nr:HAMP domain-containing sensor histidine kinase [Clostridium tagluense]MBU3127528.1 HAMP domain-containing histidine kinase [Clostridium tagluense]